MKPSTAEETSASLCDQVARLKRALAENEASAQKKIAELELIYRCAPIGLAVYDRNLRFLRVNDALARLNHLSCEEHVGISVLEVVPDFGKEIAECLGKVFESGESILNIERHRAAQAGSATSQHFLTSYYPLCGEDGSVAAVCSIVLDLSERKHAEEELRLSQARNLDLVKNSVYGIFRATADGTFQDANPALLSILGCSRVEELQALNLAKDVYRFPEQYVQHLADCRTRRRVQGVDAEWKRRDGGLVAVRLHLRHISIPGNPETIEFMAEDVTELRAMERQLRQAQKFETIGQLAGGIAHDFNNVTGAILGWAELGYEQNRENRQIAERFARIREQAERAAALTRELLTFARRQVIQPRAMDLNAMTSGLTGFLDKVIGKDIELKVHTTPVDPIRGDPTQLEQVLMNLCLNARDAMPQGGRLVVETEMVKLDDSYRRFYPGVAPGRYAVLSVSDTGIGMDNATRERIFEPFFTTKLRGKGTGMGLATVYGIVKQHNAFIHVYSEPGQGSLFRVYLPLKEGLQKEDPGATARVASLAETRGTETILLADDHEAIREMARQTLVSLGYRVLSAGDGVEALRLCENEEPALAILDVVMPKLGGPATGEKLMEKYGRIPIIFTSGYSQGSESFAVTPENAQYLQKPYSPTTLGSLVREILDKPKNHVEAS
jgi:two-component system, cell cycle sensor histidine kinase and response regulator CckA